MSTSRRYSSARSRHSERDRVDESRQSRMLQGRRTGRGASSRSSTSSYSREEKPGRGDWREFSRRALDRHEKGDRYERVVDAEFDRQWYDEQGDDTAKKFVGDEKKFEREIALITQKRQQRMSLRAQHRQTQNERWWDARLEASGVGLRDKYDPLDVDMETETRVHLITKDTQAPFLQGHGVKWTSQREAVSVVRDPTSDLARCAKAGSLTLKQHREQRDKTMMRQKFWEVGSSGPQRGSEYTGDQEDEDGAPREKQEFKKHMKDGKDQKEDAVTELRKVRESLPIFGVREGLLQVVRDNQVVIVEGQTGSGKTTQLPQYLLEDIGTSLMIACTQPRRVAAMSVAARVAEERGCELGSQVGYAIRFEDCTSRDTKIKYMTDGILLRESLTDPDLSAYSVIVMDEAHERSLNTDLLLGVLRDVLRRRRDLKLIVTSATLDAERFANFFGGAPVFKVPGRTFRVEHVYAQSPVDDYLKEAVKQVVNIHLTQPAGDILVFMTGQEDILATCALAAEKLASLAEDAENQGKRIAKMTLLPIFSQQPADVQARIFAPTVPGERKCIVATNIAETSLTVDGIRYVVDSGFCKLKVFQPRMGMETLHITPISRAAADQRAGRAGRTNEGVCFRLYTQHQYAHEMLAATVPEIQRANLGNVVLLLKSLGVEDLMRFDFLDAPPKDIIERSLAQLWVLGALADDSQLTALGRRMVDFPLDPTLSKMLCLGIQLGCGAEVLTIVSMLSVPNVFFRPNDERAEEADSAREKFVMPQSDHLTLLNVFNMWKRHGYSAHWCRKHFLQPKALRRVAEVREQLADICRSRSLPLKSISRDPSGMDVVRKCVAAAYVNNIARIKGIGEYINVRTGAPCHLHPAAAIFALGWTPDYVAYHELVLTSREFMRTVTAVEPEWLPELAPMFFSIRDDTGEKETTGESTTETFFANIARGQSGMRGFDDQALKHAMERRRKQAEMREQRGVEQKVVAVGATGSVTPSGLSVKTGPRVRQRALHFGHDEEEADAGQKRRKQAPKSRAGFTFTKKKITGKNSPASLSSSVSSSSSSGAAAFRRRQRRQPERRGL